MKLIPRHRRHSRRGPAPRIAITQDEINADVLYRGERARVAGAARPGRGRR